MRVIIPAIAAHEPTVALTLRRLRTQVPSARFLLITPAPDSFAHLGAPDLTIAEDEDYGPVSRSALRDSLAPARRHLAGWYYQQLLKYSAVSRAQEDQVLVLDADTVLLRPFDFAPGAFHTSKERNQGYFDHLRKLLGINPRLRASAIVNFMLFEPCELRAMLDEIEARHSQAWWSAIVQISNEVPVINAFSEYETYANWYSTRKGGHSEIPIHLFRRGDLLMREGRTQTSVVDLIARKGYDAAAFELNHQGSTIRRMAAGAVLALGLHPW